MINSKYIDTLTQNSEIVLHDSDIGKIIHKQLFKFDDKVYVDLNLISSVEFVGLTQADGNTNFNAFYNAISVIINMLNSNNSPHPSNIHVLLEWEHMVQLATWFFDSKSGDDICILLSNVGLKIDNINFFKYTNIQGVFIYLFQNARFDIFRRVCHLARKNIIEHINDKSIKILCHLASAETKTILASSL